MGVWTIPPVHWWIEPSDVESEDFHQQTLAWITSLGLDPNRLAPTAAVVFFDGGYELHVDEVVAHPGHGDRFDPLDQDNLLTIRRIISVAKDSWPARPMEVAA